MSCYTSKLKRQLTNAYSIVTKQSLGWTPPLPFDLLLLPAQMCKSRFFHPENVPKSLKLTLFDWKAFQNNAKACFVHDWERFNTMQSLISTEKRLKNTPKRKKFRSGTVPNTHTRQVLVATGQQPEICILLFWFQMGTQHVQQLHLF